MSLTFGMSPSVTYAVVWTPRYGFCLALDGYEMGVDVVARGTLSAMYAALRLLRARDSL